MRTLHRRSAHPLLAIALGVTATACLHAAPPIPPPPATPPAPPASQPSTQPTTTALERELEAIEAAAAKIHHLQATLRYDRIQGLLGSREVRMGTLQYDAGTPTTTPTSTTRPTPTLSEPSSDASGTASPNPTTTPPTAPAPARFRLHLDRLFVNGRPRAQDRSYIYDGRWLAERLDDQRVFIRREISPDPTTPTATPTPTPSEPSSEASGGGSLNKPSGSRDPLKLGEGPFPLPLSMDRRELQSRFHIEMIDDFEGTAAPDEEPPVHLRLTPRETFRSESAQIDIWYDPDTHLPQRVEAIDDFESQNQSIFILTDPDLQPDLDPDTFDTTPPAQEDWDIQIIRLEDN